MGSVVAPPKEVELHGFRAFDDGGTSVANNAVGIVDAPARGTEAYEHVTVFPLIEVADSRSPQHHRPSPNSTSTGGSRTVTPPPPPGETPQAEKASFLTVAVAAGSTTTSGSSAQLCQNDSGDQSAEDASQPHEKTLGEIYEEITDAEFTCRMRYYQICHGSPVIFPDDIIAAVYSVIVLLSVVVSTAAFIVETEPDLSFDPQVATALFALETASVGVMTLDFLLHATSVLRLRQLLVFSTFADLASIIGFYLALWLPDDDSGGRGTVVFILRAIRLFRVLRLVKLSRDAKGIQVLKSTASRSLDGLLLLVAGVAMATVLFSSTLWFAETSLATWDQKTRTWVQSDGLSSPYQSVPDTFWFTISTMTTVGYGDAIPVTIGGRLVSVCIMLTAVLLLCFPNILIGSSFQEVNRGFNRDQARFRLGRYFRIVRMGVRFIRMWREFKIKGRLNRLTHDYRASQHRLNRFASDARAGSSAVTLAGAPMKDVTMLRCVNFFFRPTDFDFDYLRYVPALKDGLAEVRVGPFTGFDFFFRLVTGFSGVASLDEMFESYVLFPMHQPRTSGGVDGSSNKAPSGLDRAALATLRDDDEEDDESGREDDDSSQLGSGRGHVRNVIAAGEVGKLRRFSHGGNVSATPLKSHLIEMACYAAEAKLIQFFVISRDEERAVMCANRNCVELLTHVDEPPGSMPCIRSIGEARQIWHATVRQTAQLLLPVDGLKRWQSVQSHIPRRAVTNFTYDLKLMQSRRNNVFDDLEGMTAIAQQMLMGSAGPGSNASGSFQGAALRGHLAKSVANASMRWMQGGAAVPSSANGLSLDAGGADDSSTVAAQGFIPAPTAAPVGQGSTRGSLGGGPTHMHCCAFCTISTAFSCKPTDAMSTVLAQLRSQSARLDDDAFLAMVHAVKQQAALLSTAVDVLEAARVVSAELGVDPASPIDPLDDTMIVDSEEEEADDDDDSDSSDASPRQAGGDSWPSKPVTGGSSAAALTARKPKRRRKKVPSDSIPAVVQSPDSVRKQPHGQSQQSDDSDDSLGPDVTSSMDLLTPPSHPHAVPASASPEESLRL